MVQKLDSRLPAGLFGAYNAEGGAEKPGNSEDNTIGIVVVQGPIDLMFDDVFYVYHHPGGDHTDDKNAEGEGNEPALCRGENAPSQLSNSRTRV